MILQTRRKQKGLTTVEFSICGAVYFMVLFSVIEVGRFLFVLNTLDEVTRRGARLATVCHPDDKNIVNTIARMNDNIIPNLQASNVSIQYLDLNYVETSTFSNIFYVKVSIENFSHRLLIPFLIRDISTPTFSTTSRTESLGIIPPTETTSFGLSTC